MTIDLRATHRYKGIAWNNTARVYLYARNLQCIITYHLQRFSVFYELFYCHSF